MSDIKVNKVSPIGTAFQLGESGDTITIPSGATILNSGTATGFGAAGADTSLSNLSAAGEQLACQAWVNFNGTGTPAIRDSGGINPFTSVGDLATGMYSLTFTSAMADTNYACAASVIGTYTGSFSAHPSGKDVAPSTTVISFSTENAAGSAVEVACVNVVVFGT